MNQARVQRMIWVDGFLQTNAPLRRSDMIEHLGISYAVATVDIHAFQKRWPERIKYNPKGKYYHRHPDSLAVFHSTVHRTIKEACAMSRVAASELETQ